MIFDSDDEVEIQLKRIEEKLAKGNLNHLRNMYEKAKGIKASNEIVDKINHEYKVKLKLEEENKLNGFVER